MKNLLILLMLAFQAYGVYTLVKSEGWVSGIIFFIITMIFFGLMARFAELIEQVWKRVFGKN